MARPSMSNWTTTALRKPWQIRGWPLVFIAGIVLTILAMLDAPDVSSTPAVRSADGSTGCQLRVSAAELRVRSAPSTDADQVEVLSEGAVVDGTQTVTDGFRELEGGRWAADQYLTPLPDTNCG
jgi:hypothetical protein